MVARGVVTGLPTAAHTHITAGRPRPTDAARQAAADADSHDRDRARPGSRAQPLLRFLHTRSTRSACQLRFTQQKPRLSPSELDHGSQLRQERTRVQPVLVDSQNHAAQLEWQHVRRAWTRAAVMGGPAS